MRNTIAWCLVTALSSAAAGFFASPAAIVSSLEGSATVRVGPGTARPVRAFDWLPEGATVQAASGSTLVLAFVDGSRYELRDGARATLAASGPKSTSGTVRALSSIPPLPQLAAIPAPAREGSRPAAVRLRANRLTGLYPGGGWSSLAGETCLAFVGVPGAARYQVEVEDDSGHKIFERETQEPRMALPADLLKPGAKYYWRARTLDARGPAARGETEFATLPAESAARLVDLRRVLLDSRDAATLALLGHIERGLGLALEARERLLAAASLEPHNPSLAASLRELEALLGDSAVLRKEAR
jgi:hypothetical protein